MSLTIASGAVGTLMTGRKQTWKASANELADTDSNWRR